MATTIITKFGSGAPAASDVVRGELAVDTENGRLYTETSGGAVIEIGLNPSAKITADAGIDIDNINIDGTTIALSSGNLTLDSAGQIVLDADGGEIQLKDGGTEFGQLAKSGNDFRINQAIQDGDIVFRGNDGGSVITALTLDMSNAGRAFFNAGASFNGNINANDNQKLILGTHDDLEIYHDGSNNYIDTSTGSLLIRNTNDNYHVIIQSDNGGGGLADYFRAKGDTGEALLYHYGSEKLATTSTGIDVTGSVTADGLTVDGAATISVSDNSDNLSLISTDADDNSGPNLRMYRNSASPADSDVIGQIDFEGRNDNSQDVRYGFISAKISDASDGSEDGQLRFFTIAGGTETQTLTMESAKVGIVTSSPAASLHVSETSSGLTARFSNESNQTLDIGTVSGSGSSGSVYFDNPNSGNVQFRTGGTERMRITSDGDIQIPIATNAMGKFADNISEVGSGNFALQISNTAQDALKPFGIRAEDIRFATGSSERMRVDSSGRVGIGGTPRTGWRNDLTDVVLMLGTEATFHSDAGVTTELWNNAYVDNADTFHNFSTRGASRYQQYSGAHKWFTAASASGRLLLALQAFGFQGFKDSRKAVRLFNSRGSY